jgi:hypothetical protein
MQSGLIRCNSVPSAIESTETRLQLLCFHNSMGELWEKRPIFSKEFDHITSLRTYKISPRKKDERLSSATISPLIKNKYATT